MKKLQSAFEIVTPRSASTPTTDTLRSQSSISSYPSRNGVCSRPLPSSSIDRRGNHQYKFHEMKPIDENEISVASPSPEYGYVGEDLENLKLFPKRHPDWVITSNYNSPGSSLSRSPRNIHELNSVDSKPLLINNGNISGASGRNGATLNRISNAQNNTSRIINGKRRGEGLPGGISGTTSNFQRYQRRRRGGFRLESFQVIAFICGCFAAILMLMGLTASEWLIAHGYRQL